MSTALSIRTEIAAIATVPALSGSLARCVDLLTDPENPYRHHVAVSDRDAIEAKARLQQAEHMCRPATAAVIGAWCRKLVPHLGKAPASAVEFDRAMEGVILACGDLPYAVWTGQTVAEALKVLKWWPAPSDIRAILLPFANPLWRIKNGLGLAVAAADRTAPAAEPQERTDEAKAHVAALTAAFVAERSWKDPNHVEHRAAVKACPLSDGQLLATWLKAEADGVVGASIRVAQLRQRLGATEITP